MALAALSSMRLSAELKTAEQVHAALEFQNTARILSLGVPALDEALPQRGLAYGSVIELQVRGSSGAATSFALCVCRAAQNAVADWAAVSRDERVARDESVASSPKPWCAFIDPSASLFAPGVAQLGVDLERLLVLRPKLEAVERVAVRIAEAKVVSVLIIDLRGALAELPVDDRRWQRTVRRLALAVKQLSTCVLVITRAEARHALPLPVAMRLEMSRLSSDSLELRVAKERTGRVSPPRTVAWSAFEEWRSGVAA
jgi:hypothetical protein